MRFIILLSLLSTSCGVGRVFGSLTGKGTRGPNGELIAGDGSDGDDDGTTNPGGGGGGDDPNVISGHIDPDAPGCGRGEIAPTKKTPVHFMFVLDRSGSMDDSSEIDPAGSRDTKWVALQKAVKAVFDDMGNQTGDPVAVGVNYFSDGDKKDTSIEKPMALLDRARADALMSDIDGRNPGGYTPTVDAMSIGYSALTAYQPTGVLANGTKALVLVSDGKPNPDPATANTIPDMVTAQTNAGVRTFSIGIGELGDTTSMYGYDPAFMSMIAQKGGTTKDGCDPNNTTDTSKFCHYQITPSVSGSNITTDLIDAFNAIRDALRSCTLPLQIEDAAHLEPRAVIVVLEVPDQPQRLLTKNTDWKFNSDTSPTAIVLQGAECEALKNDPSRNVFAILGCTCEGGPTGATNGGGGGGGARQSESGGGEDPWNTDWCSYPWVPSDCVGEGCPTP